MKQFAAILFSLLLAWTPFAPAAQVSACKTAMKCNDACRQMPCCAAKNSNSQNTPAVPAQKSGAQNQISILASTVAIWTLPENPANSISSTVALPLTAMSAPIYARNCALLL